MAERSEPFLYTHAAGTPMAPANGTDRARSEPTEQVIGRRYRGLFDAYDGSYVTVTDMADGRTVIDRDSFGSIPLFYSTRSPIVSTDLRLLVDLLKPDLDVEALAEYLSASYVTGGKTIYRNVRFLMPTETLTVKDRGGQSSAKRIFSDDTPLADEDVPNLLERAIGNSIDDVLERHSSTILLHLSGGADSTLLLAKIRERDEHRDIASTTFFHEDWRDDLNDWEYAAEAAATFRSRHRLVRINNESFCQAHRELVSRAKHVFYTYAAAFYAHNAMVEGPDQSASIINGSGPDESIIGTEKMALEDLLLLRALPRAGWVDHLIANIDSVKIPEPTAAGMLLKAGDGFVRTRQAIAASLLDAPDFVEFQRRYHAITVLQDHIQELTAVAQALDRVIVFPFLTNDIFRIVFSARFETLNAGTIYKSIIKGMLERYMPRNFTYRRKIGFQSPSRPYFKSQSGLGRELSRLLARGSALLDLGVVEPGIRERLSAELDLHRRYDFLEWTAYNILLLEELRGACA